MDPGNFWPILKGAMRLTAIALIFALVLPVAVLSAAPAVADQNDPRLEKLFEQLAATKSARESQPLEAAIWHIWTLTSDGAVKDLMEEGLRAMQAQDYTRALRYFDQMVAIAPDFAEGWNKRATVYYLIDDYESSLADIDRTLALEPRHFGALSGQGLVYVALDKKEEALLAFETALSVHPNMIGARRNAEVLRKILKDQEI